MVVRAIDNITFIISKGFLYKIYGTDANNFLIFGDDGKWRWIEMKHFVPA